MSMLQVQVPRHWQGCCKDHCEERWGLPYAGHSRLQSASVDPLQGTVELLSHTGDTSRKSGLRKDKILHKQWRSSTKNKFEKQPYQYQGKKGVRGSVPSAVAETPLQSMLKTMAKQVVLVQPMEDHSWTGGNALKKAEAHKDPMQ